MSWTGWILIASSTAVAWFTIAYFMGNPKFWRLVKDHPDKAYGLFILSDCLVNRKPEKDARGNYTGPFRFCTSDGNTHVVYIPANDIDGIQRRITEAITATG